MEENEEHFSKTLEIFEDGVEMVNPKSDGLSLSVALAYSPITNALKGRMRQGKIKCFILLSTTALLIPFSHSSL